jgi:hypothetical protein
MRKHSSHIKNESPVLAHYNLTAETKVVVDASPWDTGTGCRTSPETSRRQLSTDCVWWYRSLTDVEQKYGHIEKEGLAILFGCEHFHMYLYGRSFELETDDRPLEHICQTRKMETSTPRV